MSNVRSLHDYAKKEDPNKKKPTSSFTGGERSGLAVENPDDAGGDESISSSSGTALPPAGLSSWPNIQTASGPLPTGSKKVTVYKNGFVVDDGEFRSNQLPENIKFMQELQSGFAPRELQNPIGGEQVHVALIDKRTEEFVLPPSPKYELFSGEGYSMSSSSSGTSAAAVDISKGQVKVDENSSVTTIQFRLHNGQRRAQRFNESHTIADLHTFLMEVAPVAGEYRLLEGFPPKEITASNSTTIKEAGLLQAAITQKIV